MNRRGRIAATAGLLLLLVVDIALVVAALRISSRARSFEPVAIDTAAPGSTQTTAATDTPSVQAPTTTATSTSTPTSAPSVPLQVLLSAVDGTTAWRARAGACPSGGASVSVSADGGKTWRTRPSPFPVLSRVQPTDASRAFAVGATTSCDMAIKSTTDGGATWPSTGTLADALARDLKDPTKVRAPGGRIVAPCDAEPVVDLARSSATAARALCADGSIRGSSDDGSTWLKVADQPGAMALDSRVVAGAVTTYVALVKQGCEGVAVASVGPNGVTDLACVATAVPPPGSVALSVPSPEAGWLLVGDVTWRSANGLRSWARSG